MVKNRHVTPAVALILAIVFSTSLRLSAQTSQARPADSAAQQVRPATFKPPDNMDYRSVSIMSDGVRLHGEVFSLKSLTGKQLPTVIMAHGWGGAASGFRRDAIDLANAGYFVLIFDYKGWGESDSRLILTGASPIKPISGQNQKISADVTEVREVVDPLDFVADWFNAIHWTMGEPMVDKDRIGIRGSSYSGGHVVYVAGHDPRVKELVSQVGAVDSWPKAITTLAGTEAEQLKVAYDEATRRAPGELGYPEPRKRGVFGSLYGAPIRDHLFRAGFVEDAGLIRNCAALFVVAEKEELFDNKDHAKLAYDRIPGTAKKYIVIPGITHYGIYNQAYDQAMKLAIEWFDTYLKK